MKVLIADDHPIVRKVTRELIEDNFDTVDIIEAETATQSVELVKKDIPDLILMDIRFKDQVFDGIDAIKAIFENGLKPKIIVISNEDNMHHIRRLQEYPHNLTESFGYILKNEPEDTILEAIKTVLEGNYFYSKDIFKLLMQRAKASDEKIDPMVQDLSSGELDVLKAVAKGKTNEKIAEELFVSRRTVDSRLCSVYEKLMVGTTKDGVIPRVDAVLKAKKYRILTEQDFFSD